MLARIPCVPVPRRGWATWVGGWAALPPFWTAVVLTVTLSLPQAFLALPIAAASVGPLPAIVVIVITGLINMLTMACMAEAVARSAATCHGSTFIGRIVAPYLGRIGSLFLTLAMAALFFLALIASYIGLSATLSEFTGISPAVWATLLFVLGLYALSRGSLSKLSVTLLVLLGTINIVLILALSFLAFAHARPDNLLYINASFLDGRPFTASVIQRVLGVILMLYFGQALMGQVGRVVMPKDPSGRSLIRGSVVGTACSTGLFCLWVLAVNGSVVPQDLAAQSGTALGPLVDRLGPVAQWLASILVILLLGMTALRCSNVLFSLVRERLSSGVRGSFLLSVSPVVIAFLMTERLLLTGRGSFAAVLAFTGVITISLLAGIFPVLLLASSRRKARLVPVVGLRFIGHPLVLTSTYVLFLGILVFHGLVIWQNLLERAGALLVGLAAVVVTVMLDRTGAFGRTELPATVWLKWPKSEHSPGDRPGPAVVPVGGPV